MTVGLRSGAPVTGILQRLCCLENIACCLRTYRQMRLTFYYRKGKFFLKSDGQYKKEHLTTHR